MSDNNAIDSVRNLFGNVGSFWIDQLSDPKQHADLIDLTGRAVSDMHIHTPVKDISGQNDIRRNVRVKFRYDEVFPLRAAWQRTLYEKYTDSDGLNVLLVYNDPELVAALKSTGVLNQSNDGILADEVKKILLFPNIALAKNFGVAVVPEQIQPLYAMRWRSQYHGIPLEIRTQGKSLVLGTDFTVQPGIILFRENPVDMFPDMHVLVRTSRMHVPEVQIWSGMTGHSGYLQYEDIARYRLSNQGAGAFVAAALSYAGVPMLKEPDTLIQIIDNAPTRPFSTYVYKNAGAVQVPTHPEPDRLGDYPAYWVPGDIVRVTFPGGPRSLYEGTFDVTRTLPLGPLSAAKDVDEIYLPGVGSLNTEAVSGTAPNLHMRFPVNGPDHQIQKFFDAWHDWENRSGAYFSNAVTQYDPLLTFSAIGDSAMVPVHFLYLKYLLANRGFVFSILEPYANALTGDRLKYFASDERPVYATPLFLKHRVHMTGAQIDRYTGVQGF